MNKFIVGAISLCLLAGCATSQQTASTRPAKSPANCTPATGSHIVDPDDCGGYSSGAVKRAQIQNGRSDQGVLGGAAH